jgi:hypothetical protein
MSRPPASGQIAKAASALLLSALIVFISLLGVSPELHKWLHADADAADHSCAVTLFAKGQVDAVTVLPLVAGLMMLLGFVALLSETFLYPLANYRYSRSRAPPSDSSRLG